MDEIKENMHEKEVIQEGTDHEVIIAFHKALEFEREQVIESILKDLVKKEYIDENSKKYLSNEYKKHFCSYS